MYIVGTSFSQLSLTYWLFFWTPYYLVYARAMIWGGLQVELINKNLLCMTNNTYNSINQWRTTLTFGFLSLPNPINNFNTSHPFSFYYPQSLNSWLMYYNFLVKETHFLQNKSNTISTLGKQLLNLNCPVVYFTACWCSDDFYYNNDCVRYFTVFIQSVTALH